MLAQWVVCATCVLRRAFELGRAGQVLIVAAAGRSGACSNSGGVRPFRSPRLVAVSSPAAPMPSKKEPPSTAEQFREGKREGSVVLGVFMTRIRLFAHYPELVGRDTATQRQAWRWQRCLPQDRFRRAMAAAASVSRRCRMCRRMGGRMCHSLARSRVRCQVRCRVGGRGRSSIGGRVRGGMCGGINRRIGGRLAVDRGRPSGARARELVRIRDRSGLPNHSSS